MKNKSFAVLAALSMSQVQALTAKDVIHSIHNITELSTDTLDVVKDLHHTNLTANALTTLQNFRLIATAANDTANAIATSHSPLFAKQGQLDICHEFTSFGKISRDLLDKLVDQKNVLSTTAFTMPIAAVLRFVKGGVDKLAFQVIGLVPTCEDEAKNDLKGFDETMKSAWAVYPIQLHLPGVIGVPLETGFGG